MIASTAVRRAASAAWLSQRGVVSTCVAAPVVASHGIEGSLASSPAPLVSPPCVMRSQRGLCTAALAPASPHASIGIYSPGHLRALFSSSSASSDSDFTATVAWVNESGAAVLGADVLTTAKLLQLYGLYKQATVGPCTAPKPGAFDFKAKAKWSQWSELGDMPAAEAAAQYIAVVDAMKVEAGVGGSPSSDTSAGVGASAASHGGSSDAAAADYTGIRVTNDGRGVTTIQLSRPQKLNALSHEMYHEIRAALDACAEDRACTVALLTGTGPYYSAGFDLKEFMVHASEDPTGFASTAGDTLEAFVNAFVRFPKPLVAAVNGPAIGIPVTTLGLCDVVYASHTATFNTPFTTLGLSPEGCASLTFPRIMGPATANEVLLMGRKLNAVEAKRVGLVTEVFEASIFKGEVARRVGALAALPTLSLQHSKALIRSPEVVSELAAANKAECDRLRERWLSADCANAVASFLSRKKA